MVADDRGRVAFADNAMRQLSGYPPAELVGREVDLLVPDGQRARHASYRRTFAEEPRSRPMGVPLDTMLRHRDGHDVPVDISLSPIEVQGRQFVVAAIRDATEHREVINATRRALERERAASAKLREVAQTKNAFIRAVSHELRTPLTVIQGLSATLQERLDVLSGEQVTDLAGRLARNAERLDKLLSDVLDVDRLTRGVVEANRRTLDVVALTRQVLEQAGPSAAGATVEGPDELLASVDAAQVERILENLLVNAARHNAPGTPVTVRWGEDEARGGVLLCVEDEGQGVDAEMREAIFEPFTQADPDGDPTPGTGVGLSLVAQFARLHGGEAWVEDRPGGGSSFRVLLPPERESEDPGGTIVVLR